jgi:hypothetical protein
MTIVGWSSTTPYSQFYNNYGWYGGPPIHAVLWTASGTIRDLGTLPGDTLSEATKVNFFGLAIGLREMLPHPTRIPTVSGMT